MFHALTLRKSNGSSAYPWGKARQELANHRTIPSPERKRIPSRKVQRRSHNPSARIRSTRGPRVPSNGRVSLVGLHIVSRQSSVAGPCRPKGG